jgi:DNA-binding transcriptional LysR family regulator
MDLSGLDLNLLIPLRVLLTERHVTRAAEKLGITQPAMSASLARLRALFDDQLLVRGPKRPGADGARSTAHGSVGSVRRDD